MKDPDLQVRHAIELVFERFAKICACPKVLKGAARGGDTAPTQAGRGLHAGHIARRKPSESAIHEILTNPASSVCLRAYGLLTVLAKSGLHSQAPCGGVSDSVTTPILLISVGRSTWLTGGSYPDNASNYSK